MRRKWYLRGLLLGIVVCGVVLLGANVMMVESTADGIREGLVEGSATAAGEDAETLRGGAARASQKPAAGAGIATSAPEEGKALPRPTRAPAQVAQGDDAGALLRGLRNAAGTQQPDMDSAKKPAQGLVADKLTFLLVTWSKDLAASRIELLVASLAKFYDPAGMHELLMVVPAADLEMFEKQAQTRFGVENAQFRIRVVNEEDVAGVPKARQDALLPRLESREHGGRGANYRMQMLYKLGAAAFVETTFYMTMDNDVFLKRKAAFKDFVRDGRALVQGKAKDSNHRQGWWEVAGRIVKSKTCGFEVTKAHGDLVIGVTPAIMHTDLTRDLLRFITDSYPDPATGAKAPWHDIMFQFLSQKPWDRRGDWTEYTLYWSYACTVGAIERLHVTDAQHKLYDVKGFHYFNNAAAFSKAYNAKAVFEDQSTYFGVLQSINGMSPESVRSAIAPYLQ
eukprot:TRINITY_DN13491_c0_g1_i1.p1 TRINITY_DN13491_c0_g1~~TRINITY_DN13491_c0_g1_i1.p1  ORF type:complete len:452 (+),score=127.52 TRINITY_DN13491_c0_g1_i1:87-1442(+)